MVGYRWFQAKAHQPQFPFGFGLSYTQFAYSGLHVAADGSEVTFTVRNTGARSGDEVAQVYVTLPGDSGEPFRRLAVWKRIPLAAGESQTVHLPLDPLYLSIFSVEQNHFVRLSGNYLVEVGSASMDLPLHTRVNLTTCLWHPRVPTSRKIRRCKRRHVRPWMRFLGGRAERKNMRIRPAAAVICLSSFVAMHHLSAQATDHNVTDKTAGQYDALQGPVIAEHPLYADTKAPTEARITALLQAMTLNEKIDSFGTNPTVPRLGIVGTGHVEGLHGLALGGPGGWEGRGQEIIPTTTFPQARGLGQTWNPALLTEVAAEEAYETRYAFGKYHRGGLTVRAPNTDLSRDPRWGRSEESYAEDPFLVGTLAAAFSHGLQGDGKYWMTASLLKHFLANSNEDGRGGSSSNFDQSSFTSTMLRRFAWLSSRVMPTQ